MKKSRKRRKIPYFPDGGNVPLNNTNSLLYKWDNNSIPDYVSLRDNRKIDYLGRAINPNKDLYTGKYDTGLIEKIINEANKQGYNPYKALSVALTETNLGNTDDINPFHLSQSDETEKLFNGIDINNRTQDDFVRLGITQLKNKQEYAKKLGYNSDEYYLQAYNGMGKLTPNSDFGFYDRPQSSFYGVPVTKENPLDLSKNPIYGKKVLDAMNNVIMKDPIIKQLVESNLEKNKYQVVGTSSNGYLGGPTDIPTHKKGGQVMSSIHINPKNKGKFNALKKRTGKTTEELTHSKNPLTKKRAVFAQNAKRWNHKMGGYASYAMGGGIDPYTQALSIGMAGMEATDQLADTIEPENPIGAGHILNYASQGIFGLPKALDAVKDKQAMVRDEKQQFLRNQPIMVNNVDPYGLSYKKGGNVYKMEDGGQPEDKTFINIQRGEGIVRPNDKGQFDIIQDFENPNRFFPHEKSQMKEPHGNFIMAEPTDIVIDKPNWKKFKKLDNISRNTIVRNILERQKENPMQHFQMKQGGFVPVQKMALGGGTDPVSPVFIDPNYRGGLDYLGGDIPNRVNFAPPIDPNEVVDFSGALPEIPNINNPLAQPTMNSLRNEALGATTPITGGDGSLGRTLKDLVPYISDANQFIGSFKKDKIQRLRNPNSQRALSLLEDIPTNYDITANLGANERDYLNAVKNVNQGINPATNQAVKAQLLSNKFAVNNQLFGTKINAENQLKTSKNTTLAGALQSSGAEDTQYQAKFLDDLLRQKATQRTIRNSSLSGASTKFQQQQNYYKKLKTLGEIGKYFTVDKNGNIIFKSNPDLIINQGV